jgi:hypothetical protein
MYISCLVYCLTAAFPFISPSSAALLIDPSQLKANYNFIVIGGELPAYNSMSLLTDQRKLPHSWNRWKCHCQPSNRKPTNFRLGSRSRRFVRPLSPLTSLILNYFSQSLYRNEGVLASQIPFLAPTLTPNTLYDWNYTTTAQPGFNGRSIPYPRGRILGGSSSVSKPSYRLSS